MKQGTIKLNYDGADKGNLGSTGFGGAFRNAQGEILWIYEGNIDTSTNNTTELHGLEHEITIAKHCKFSPLIIEGDSTLAMQVSRKLQKGMDTAKVSDNWHLNKMLQRIKNNIESMEGIHFQEIRREGKKLVNRLDNEGTSGNLWL